MNKILRLRSPAKVNLRLEILKKRRDGYHEIRTVFQKISLCDTIDFSLREEKGISITTNQPNLPVDGGNLVYKTACILFSRLDYHGGLSIHIDKRIPLGAGLGGGSSNAAATITAIDRLLGTNLSQNEMKEIGGGIGADVPFFFFDGGAIATGIGERLEKADLPMLRYVLIYPGFEVSTRWAYQNYRLTKRKFHLKIQEFLATPERVCKILMNDLEEVVSREFPQIGLMKNLLESAGASGSLMTGSGPTVFGIFPDERGAAKAYRKLQEPILERGWALFKVHGILT